MLSTHLIQILALVTFIWHAFKLNLRLRINFLLFIVCRKHVIFVQDAALQY